MRLLLLLFIIPPALVAQQKEFGWLVGTWKEEYRNDSIQGFEIWKIDRGILQGEYFQLKHEKKIFASQFKLLSNSQSFFLVTKDNDEKVEEFMITFFNERSFVGKRSNDNEKILYTKMDENHFQIQQESERIPTTRLYFTKVK
ncbi:MAG TPA: hypothetical protein DGG95_02240 [Cytophagales bacterium]|nr:hypothetical protein [Cytophagales bacterium]